MNVSAGVIPPGLVKRDFSPACWLTSISPGSVSMSLVQRQPPAMLWEAGGVISWCFGNSPAMKVQRMSQGQGDMVLSYMHICACVFWQAEFEQWLRSVLCRRRKQTAVTTSRKQLSDNLSSHKVSSRPESSPGLPKIQAPHLPSLNF